METSKLASIALVALGGSIGSSLRYLLGLGLARFHTLIPLATITVNLTGSFFLGLLVALSQIKLKLPESIFLFLTTGLLGGFTTFSSYQVQLAQYLKTRQVLAFISDFLLQNLLGLLLALAGMSLANLIVKTNG